jgi:hypothetical protein
MVKIKEIEEYFDHFGKIEKKGFKKIEENRK